MDDTVYHYCSMSTFLSIIRNRSVWLTALRDSNDAQEGTWARRIFEYLRPSPTSEYFRKASYILDSATSGGKEVLGICFSGEGDLLSQWRGYAEDGTGFSIGFDVDSLKRLSSRIQETDRLRLELEDVEYIDHLDEEFLKDFKEFVDRQEFSESGQYTNIGIDNVGLRTWVKRLSLIKNPAFREEKESRLFSLFPESNTHIVNYRQAKSKISKYIEISFEEELEDIITSVKIGPKNLSEEKAVRDFIRKAGFTNVYDVSKSRASYR